MQDKKMHLWRRYKWQNKKRNRVQHNLQNAQTEIKCTEVDKSGQKAHSTSLS